MISNKSLADAGEPFAVEDVGVGLVGFEFRAIFVEGGQFLRGNGHRRRSTLRFLHFSQHALRW